MPTTDVTSCRAAANDGESDGYSEDNEMEVSHYLFLILDQLYNGQRQMTSERYYRGICYIRLDTRDLRVAARALLVGAHNDSVGNVA